MIFVTLKFYTHSVPTERISRCSLFLQTFSFLRNLFYLGKFCTNIAFLRNAFLGLHYFYKPFVPMELYFIGEIFYTYSVPTERLSRSSLFLQTFRSYRTLFYLGKFSTHIAFLRNAFLGVHYFYKPFVPTEIYFIWENFLQIYRSYGTLHRNPIFHHLASNILTKNIFPSIFFAILRGFFFL